jgi:selenocysteine lyase/cysteine desulfurase
MGLDVRVCVFETITSMPAARFPFEAISSICKARGILSVIDGAHGVGQIPIDLGELNPDFFVSNCHK